VSTGNGLTDALQVACGYDHCCGLDTTGRVYCWGANAQGQLGSPGPSFSPTPVLANLGPGRVVVDIATGGTFSCALTDAGEVLCWGQNLRGQFGDGSNTASSVPVLVGTYPLATDLFAGTARTCVAQPTPTGLSCAGRNTDGELGDGSLTDQWSPVTPAGLVYPTRPFGGGRHSCVLGGVRDVFCYGANDFGQLGVGTTSGPLLTPVSPLGGSRAAAVADGGLGNHTCIIDLAGQVLCWGNNESGQLGMDSAGGPVPVPTPVTPPVP
jgi:alpha-tubulin suppressor-like RCC1 family protein